MCKISDIFTNYKERMDGKKVNSISKILPEVGITVVVTVVPLLVNVLVVAKKA